MHQRRPRKVAARIDWLFLAVPLFLLLASPVRALEQAPFFITPVAETKIDALPPGDLYWRVETFPSRAEADSAAAANPTSLAASVSGRIWLITLGPAGGATSGATKVAEIGPVPGFAAPSYVLRINHAGGPPGARTPPHMHPGSESFYVIAGEVGQKTPHGEVRTQAGHTMVGHGPNMPMEVFSAGTSDLDQLVMFVLDATKPASLPAKLE